jgi:hypothetical protein
MIGHMGSHEFLTPEDRRIKALEAEVERLKKTEQFLRSERPMARRLTEYELLLERAMKNLESVMLYGPLHADISDALDKKEKPNGN